MERGPNPSKAKSKKTKKRSAAAASASTSTSASNTATPDINQLSKAMTNLNFETSLPDLTRRLSDNPLIICSNTKVQNAPHFLYLFDGDLVIVGPLPNLVRIAARKVWKNPLPKRPDQPCFIIDTVPGKGLGMLATRKIKAGELVHSERPIFVTPEGITGKGISESAFKHISPSSKSVLGALTNAHTSESGYSPLDGLLNSNYLSVNIAETPEAVPIIVGGICPVICRVNHDCTPSTNFYFSPTTFEGQLYAMRDIPAGEEITHQYVFSVSPRAHRQGRLQRDYNFRCTSATCELSPALVAESDARRVKLHAFTEGILSSSAEERSAAMGAATLADVREAVAAAEKEGIPQERARALKAGAYLSAKFRAYSQGILWSRMAAETYKMTEGPDSFELGSCARIEASLKSYRK